MKTDEDYLNRLFDFLSDRRDEQDVTDLYNAAVEMALALNGAALREVVDSLSEQGVL